VNDGFMICHMSDIPIWKKKQETKATQKISPREKGYRHIAVSVKKLNKT
jgi:hypothetical protein